METQDGQQVPCRIEQIMDRQVGPFMFVVGQKVATLAKLCEDCPMVDTCQPEFWRLKNQVRVQTRSEL